MAHLIGRLAFLPPKGWSQHVWLLGPIGSGKSTLVVNLVLQDLRAGRAAVVIDPTKGDLYNDVMPRIPAGLEHKVCVIDPTDPKHAVGINILASRKPDLAADHAVGLFRRLYASSWGDRLEDYLRHACLTLARIDGAVLLDIPRLLQDHDWREELVAELDDRDPDVFYLRQFWREFDGAMRSRTAQNEIRPLTHKLRTFIPGVIRPIVAQRSPRADPFALVDKGGLILVRAPVGELGEGPARILGAVAVARFWDRIAARSNRPARARRQATLYADELHEFVSDVGTLRRTIVLGRGLNGVLFGAHQYLGQLPSDLAGALAQVGTKACFALPPDDARSFARNFEPRLTPDDVQSLPPYHVALRLPVGESGRGTVIVARTLPLPKIKADRTADVLAVSRGTYGRPRAEVEAEIRAWAEGPHGSDSDPGDGGDDGSGGHRPESVPRSVPKLVEGGTTSETTGGTTSRPLRDRKCDAIAESKPLRNELLIRKKQRSRASPPAGTAAGEAGVETTSGGAGTGSSGPESDDKRDRRVRLTPRDRDVCAALREHGVLTGEQLGALHFPGLPKQSRNRRLGELVECGLLARFRPDDDVTRPWHYVLASTGARVVLRQRGWRTPTPSEAHLPHRLAANDFFVDVMEAARSQGDWQLTEWLGERGCRQRWGQAGLVPDGFGVLSASDGRRVRWFLEIDRGTEGMELLVDKARAYRRLGETAPVLFCLSDELRARRLIAALSSFDEDLLVATTTFDQHHADPLGPIWRLRAHQGSVSLLDLGTAVGVSQAGDQP